LARIYAVQCSFWPRANPGLYGGLLNSTHPKSSSEGKGGHHFRLALCLGSPEDLEAAQHCADEAASLLKPAHQDYVWRELQDLKRKLRGAGNINSKLREWSQGIVGNKSFQQVSEEFASIVIPKVETRRL
jgi:hypothetical protein